MPVKIWSLPVNYKQLLDCCCPHRAATYFCLESVSELDLPGKFVSLFQLAGPSPHRVNRGPQRQFSGKYLFGRRFEI